MRASLILGGSVWGERARCDERDGLASRDLYTDPIEDACLASELPSFLDPEGLQVQPSGNPPGHVGPSLYIPLPPSIIYSYTAAVAISRCRNYNTMHATVTSVPKGSPSHHRLSQSGCVHMYMLSCPG